jgi:hypothetical protein
MQIINGTVSISSVTPTLVQGDSEVDWTQVTAGSLFILGAHVSRINAINLGTSTLTLEAAYPGSTITGAAYVIVRDFTANYNLPLLNRGDLEASVVFSRAMQVIDGMLGSSGGAAEITLVKSSHNFVVGNALRFNGSTIQLATSVDAATSTIFGIVSTVVDANTFKVITQGRVTSIAGIGNLVVGQTYYLRNALSEIAGQAGKYVNLTTDDSGTWSTAGTNHVPVLIADSVSSGFVLNFASMTTGVFGTDRAGAVPGPTASDVSAGKLLNAAGNWVVSSVGNNSIASQHLKSTGTPTPSVSWANFVNGVADLAVKDYIIDLYNQIGVLSSRNPVITKKILKLGQSFTVPASGVTQLQITWYQNFAVAGPGILTGAGGALGGVAVTGKLSVQANQTISFEVTRPAGYNSFMPYLSNVSEYLLKKQATTVVRVGNTSLPRRTGNEFWGHSIYGIYHPLVKVVDITSGQGFTSLGIIGRPYYTTSSVPGSYDHNLEVPLWASTSPDITGVWNMGEITAFADDCVIELLYVTNA